MRAVARCLVALSVVAATAVASPAQSSQAASQPPPFTIASVLPTTGEVVGVAHPVVVTFSGPIANRQAAERAIHIASKPTMTGTFEWLETNVVQWVPDRHWPSHSTIALSVGPLSTDFKTGPAVLGVADISDHTFTVSVDGVGATPPPPLPAPHHRPHWGEDGVMLASMGRPEFPTPVGVYTVLSKDRSMIMDSSSVGVPLTDPAGYRVPVDYAVRITRRGIFVHSAPWAVNSLGFENVSHGCISLSPADAEWYFNAVNVGDPVIVKE
jgi:lipoprotein-anchoring transpeptidase ErfK/SrfK